MTKKKMYLPPEVEVWHLSMPCNILEALSLEGNVDDLVEGDTLESIPEW